MIDEAQLEKLSVSEKLRIVTSLWDQIARSDQPIYVPDADRRINEMMTDPSCCLSEDEIWRQADDLR